MSEISDEGVYCLAWNIVLLGGNVTVLKSLFKQHHIWVDYAYPRKNGRTLLMCVKSVSMVNVLLEAGANPNAKDRTGMTPLIWACMSRKNQPVIRRLVAAGADMEYQLKGSITPLSMSCVLPENVRCLLNLHAYPSYVGEEGRDEDNTKESQAIIRQVAAAQTFVVCWRRATERQTQPLSSLPEHCCDLIVAHLYVKFHNYS
jgi:ankyrin repeat protein